MSRRSRLFVGACDLLAVLWVPSVLTSTWRELNPHYGQGELWFWLAVLSLPVTLLAAVVAVFGLATGRPVGRVLSIALCAAGGVVSILLAVCGVVHPELFVVGAVAAAFFGGGLALARRSPTTTDRG